MMMKMSKNLLDIMLISDWKYYWSIVREEERFNTSGKNFW